MEVVDRIWRLPVMESAWNTSHNIYDRVKNANGLAHWTLSTAEGAMHMAVETIAPMAHRLSTPIHVVDMKLCQGLDLLEQKVPIVKEQPQQVGEILESTKELVSCKVVQHVIQTASAAKQVNVASLKDLSWTKANEILESRYGHMALQGLDSTTSVADNFLNYYLPEDEEEEEDDNQRLHPSSECDDKVLHTAHTVGRLSNKVGRRVYRTLSQRLNNINKQNINEYLNNLSLVVQLTSYLNSVNQGVEQRSGSATNTPTPSSNGIN